MFTEPGDWALTVAVASSLFPDSGVLLTVFGAWCLSPLEKLKINPALATGPFYTDYQMTWSVCSFTWDGRLVASNCSRCNGKEDCGDTADDTIRRDEKKHPDAVLLFRVGDFYETFSEDAITASEILGITLHTPRQRQSLVGGTSPDFPHHALDTHLPKLVRAGKRVAICEQP